MATPARKLISIFILIIFSFHLITSSHAVADIAPVAIHTSYPGRRMDVLICSNPIFSNLRNGMAGQTSLVIDLGCDIEKYPVLAVE
jgi:hypothetical protein